jgi:hypothetical protein
MVKVSKSSTERLLLFLKNKEDEFGLKISLIQNEDAEFIFELRNSNKARHLNGTVEYIDQQIFWIQEYKKRERAELEFYFIFWNGIERIGTIRFIKMDETTFESGSWLFIDNIPFIISVKAELFCKDFAFEFFNFRNCYFYMNKKNVQVIRYHTLFEPIKIKEDKDYVYFMLDKERYYSKRSKILAYCT